MTNETGKKTANATGRKEEKDEHHFSTSSTRTAVFETPTREISAQPPRQRPRWLLERQPEECISLNGGKEKKRRKNTGCRGGE